jgi:uncharacterized membrane protein YagU involved in acid resistance
MKTLRSLLAGATAGAVATVAMSALMLAAKRIGITGTLPPELIARKAVEAVALDPPDDGQGDAVAAVAHIGFGAVAGVIFELLTIRALAARRSAAIGASAGALYGTGIWLVSYQGWVPALGIMPAASRDRRGRVATMLAAHWVYGAALGVLTTFLRR